MVKLAKLPLVFDLESNSFSHTIQIKSGGETLPKFVYSLWQKLMFLLKVKTEKVQ